MEQRNQRRAGQLKIVVCIKQVPLLSALRFDPQTHRLVREGVPLEINELDVYALAEAVRLRDLHGGEVIAITMGPPQAHEALAAAIASGADRAVHLNDRAFGGADTFATARALAMAIEREQPDLIFCGRHSIDAETSQVGPEIAEMLGIPQISATLKIQLVQFDGVLHVIAERETDDGSEQLTAPLPALLTTAERINEGIWPDEEAIHVASAQSEHYQVVTAADLSPDTSLFGEQGSPTWVSSVEPDSYVRQGRVLSGDDPRQLVNELVSILEAKGLLDAGTAATPQAAPHTENASNTAASTILRKGQPLPDRAVWVIAERSPLGIRKVTLELLGKGAELAAALQGELAALLIGGDDVEQHAATLAAYGAERVYVAANPALTYYTTDGYTAVVTSAIRNIQPTVVLLGSTADGRDLAPRVAARLRIGLTGDCIDLGVDEQLRLVQHKPAFGNQILSSILSNTLPAMATLRPGMLRQASPDFSRAPLIEYLPAEGVEHQIRTSSIDRVTHATGREPLESARIIIGIGMGVGDPEHYGEVYRLAELLRAAVGATRNVTDQGWLSKRMQIGLTGHAVAPRLYFALGIRGAAEHIAGIRKAEYVMSINKNKRAAIFRHSDLGIVGDVHELLPLLIERLEHRTGTAY